MANFGKIRALVSFESAAAKAEIGGVSAKFAVGTDVFLGAAKVLMTGLTSRFAKPKTHSKQ